MQRQGFIRAIKIVPFLLLLAAFRAAGFEVNDITRLAVTNSPAQFLVAADIAQEPDPAYNRGEIHVAASVHYATLESTNTTYDYNLKFRLLNQAGVPVSLQLPGGLGSGTEYIVPDVITLPTVGRNPVSSITRDYAANLLPLTQLSAADRYHVEMSLSKRLAGGGIGYSPTGGTSNTPPVQYYHFTNTIPSGDAAKNVIAEVRGVHWGQATACKGVDGQNRFSVLVDYRLVSFDDIYAGYASATIDTSFTVQLNAADSGAAVPLTGMTTNITVNVPNHDNLFFAPFTQPSITDGSVEVFFEPGPVLDGVNHGYVATVSISHLEQPNLSVAGNDVSGDPLHLLHLSGNLNFGPLATRLTAMTFGPGSTTLDPPVIHTSISVAGGGAYVINHPDHTVAGGTLGVDVNSAGDALVTLGGMALVGPKPDPDTNHNVVFARGLAQVGPAGASCSNLLALLPTGLGYRFDTNADGLLNIVYFNGQYALDGDLAPSGTVAVSANVFLAEESKPLWLNVSDVRWQANLGEFHFTPIGATYVRARQIAFLAELSGAIDNIKASNELLFGAVNGFAPGTELVVRAGDNGESLVSATLTLGPGIFLPHFPVGSGPIPFTNGVMQVVDDLIVTSNSVINGVTGFYGVYSRNCADAGTNCGASGQPQVSMLAFVPDNEQLHITRDGGLVGEGTLVQAGSSIVKRIRWGVTADPAQPVHAIANDFPAARFCMAGSFLRGNDGNDNGFNAPGQLLFSGVNATDWNQCDRVGSPGYADGTGDYAGINLRAQASQTAVSFLAGALTQPYPLNPRSKYYVRGGGVTGIHEGQFNQVQLAAGGPTYAFSFSLFSLAYLDNENVDSRTAGNIHIPGVAGAGDPGFGLAFDKLEITCNGGLGAVKLGNSSLGATNHLTYWNSDVVAQALKFVTPDLCNPSSALLVLGVSADCALLDKKIYGELGFLTDGNLTTTNDGFASFLQVPNNIAIHGQASGGDYHFIPGQAAYLNNARELPGGAATGFLDIPGSLDVAFFENLAVNLHTQARTNSGAPLYLMAALPDPDPNQRGFPLGVSLADFRVSPPHAQRDWLAGIHFDYPLKWNDSQRNFRSSAPANNSFLVLNVQHEVKALDAKNAELTFGIKSEGLPQLNIVNLATDATGIGAKVQNAIGAAANAAIQDGLAQFDSLLNPLAATILSVPIASLCDPVSDQLYTDLADPQNFNWQNSINQRCNGGFGAGPVSIFSQLQNLASTVNGVTNLTVDLTQRLDKIIAGLNSVNAVVDDAPKIVNLAQQLVSLVPGVEIPPDVLAAQVAQVEAARSEIHAEVANVIGKITELRTELAGGAFVDALAALVASRTGDLQSVAKALADDLNAKINFSTINSQVESFPQVYTRDQFKQMVRDAVADHLGGQVFAQQLSTMLRENFFDANALTRQATDSLFAQINDLVRDAISSASAALDDSLAPLNGSAVSKVMRAGKINGYAHIIGDSLDELRLDLKVQMDAPSPLDVQAWLRIKSLQSDGIAGCGYGGTPENPATEIVLGAESSKLDWISPGLAGKMETKFTLGPDHFPKGVAGKLEITGGLHFEAFSVDYLSAYLAFGAQENYLAAAAKLTFQSYSGAGGFFFGRTCTTDPLSWDPLVANAIGTPPFTGVYVFGEAWVPVSEALLGIPATCFFRVDANVGCGMGFFTEGPTFIGRAELGLSGHVLCLLSASADANLVGIANPSGVTLSGTGEFCAEIGVWPAEFDICKTASLKYQNKHWSVGF